MISTHTKNKTVQIEHINRISRITLRLHKITLISEAAEKTLQKRKLNF